MERHSFERVPKVIEAFVKTRHTANALSHCPLPFQKPGFQGRPGTKIPETACR